MNRRPSNSENLSLATPLGIVKRLNYPSTKRVRNNNHDDLTEEQEEEFTILNNAQRFNEGSRYEDDNIVNYERYEWLANDESRDYSYDARYESNPQIALEDYQALSSRLRWGVFERPTEPFSGMWGTPRPIITIVGKSAIAGIKRKGRLR